ncbi:Small ribosomal subunit protein bS6m-like protein [Drosera capensis]
MPLYDCMLLLKPTVSKEALMDLVSRVGRHVIARNGVLTEIKSFGTVELGYGIKKLDGRYFQGRLMQMTMMATPNINKELHYLNKEDRLLRWIVVKHRNVELGPTYDDDEDDRKLLGGEDDDIDEDDDDEDAEDADENDEINDDCELQGNEKEVPA